MSTTPEGATYVKRIYRESGKGSFVAYAFTYSQYGDAEFEFLVFVDAEGKIEKIQKILWKVSDAAPDWGYNPPSEERVNELFASLVGKNANTVGSVDIETGATNTAGKVRDAALEALGFFEGAKTCYAPRIIGISALVLGAIISAAAVVIYKKRRTVKK